MTTERPASIVGGVRYDYAGVPGGKPSTAQFVVAWRDLRGLARFVQSATFWVGDRRTMDIAHLGLAAAVARHMLSHPPI